MNTRLPRKNYIIMQQKQRKHLGLIEKQFLFQLAIYDQDMTIDCILGTSNHKDKGFFKPSMVRLENLIDNHFTNYFVLLLLLFFYISFLEKFLSRLITYKIYTFLIFWKVCYMKIQYFSKEDGSTDKVLVFSNFCFFFWKKRKEKKRKILPN